MASQRFWCLSFMLTWIFVFFLPPVCSGIGAPNISLESTVFMALAGENLSINYVLEKPANQSKDSLKCFNPSNKRIYDCDFPATADSSQQFKKTFVLENLKTLNDSGEYYCQYKTAKVYWFLRVRDGGYKEDVMWDYTEIITLSVFTGVLLVFSVVGSVYVFRGHWKEKITECGNSGRKRKQNREERKEEELKEDCEDTIAASSTSFYATLEPRPASIYDVLDHSAANRKPDQSKAASKTKGIPKTMVQTTQKQDEGVFESVYENF